MSRLKGKTALVTGGSRGIGKGIALELARQGAKVAINYRGGAQEAEAVAREIRAMDVEPLVIQADVSKPDEARKLVGQVLETWERLDILVNNAGITRDKTLKKLTDDDWDQVIQTNLNSVYYTLSAAQNAMMAQQFGRVINISSFIGQAGAFGQTNYAASKGGIIAFTKAAALELAKYNITVNSICPGYTETEMVAAIPAQVQEKLLVRVPMGRFGRVQDVARTVTFLAADGDYITGQQINVNGGVYM